MNLIPNVNKLSPEEIIGVVKWEMTRTMMQAVFQLNSDLLRRGIERKITEDTAYLRYFGVTGLTTLCNEWNNPAEVLDKNSFVVEVLFEIDTHTWKIVGTLLVGQTLTLDFSVVEGEVETP